MRRLRFSSALRWVPSCRSCAVASETVEILRKFLQARAVANPGELIVIESMRGTLAQLLGTTEGGLPPTDTLLQSMDDVSYRVQGGVVPCEWSQVMDRVRRALPVEGVLEAAFIRYIAAECLDFTGESVRDVRKWVQAHFSAYIRVSTSTEGSHMIYRPVLPLPEKGAELIVALESLVPLALPCFVDGARLADAVGRSVDSSFVAELRDMTTWCEVEVDIGIRDVPAAQRTVVYVDGTSMTVGEVDAIVGKMSPAPTVVVYRWAHNPPFAASDVVISDILEPHHAVAAAMAGAPQVGRVVCICADGALESWATIFEDMPSMKGVTVKTPTKERVL